MDWALALKILACAAVYPMAAYAPPRVRREAVALALAFQLTWMAVLSSWTPASVPELAKLFGLAVYDEPVWVFCYAAYALAALLIAPRLWAAWALWAVMIYLEICLGIASLMETPYGEYRHGLDLGFYSVVAVFAAIGGKGMFEHGRAIFRDLVGIDRAVRRPSLHRSPVQSEIAQ